MFGCRVGASVHECGFFQDTMDSFVFRSSVLPPRTHTITHTPLTNNSPLARCCLKVCTVTYVRYFSLFLPGGARPSLCRFFRQIGLGPLCLGIQSGRQRTFGGPARDWGMMVEAEGQRASRARSSHRESTGCCGGHLYTHPDGVYWRGGWRGR